MGCMGGISTTWRFDLSKYDSYDNDCPHLLKKELFNRTADAVYDFVRNYFDT